MSALLQMLNELDSHKLEVQLVPLNPRLRGWNEGGCKRIVTDYPPKWYRTLCSNHQSSRGIRRGKFDTKIKRANVLRALRQMLRGISAGKYEAELRAISRQQKAA